jgi:hypothetical protein
MHILDMLAHEINVLWVPTLASVSAVTEAFPFRSFTILPPVSDRRLDLLFLFLRANFCCRCFSEPIFAADVSLPGFGARFPLQRWPRFHLSHRRTSPGFHSRMKFILAMVTTGDTDFHVSLQLWCLVPTNLPKAVLFLLSSFFPLLHVHCSAHADY